MYVYMYICMYVCVLLFIEGVINLALQKNQY